MTTPTRFVALLRGINVGGRNKVPMADLREAVVDDVRWSDVETYIQSGNLCFTPPRRSTPVGLASDLRVLLDDRFGVDSPVVVLSKAQIGAALAAYPFEDPDPSHCHFGFALGDLPALDDLERFLPERAAVAGPAIGLSLPNGMGRARLPATLDRRQLLTYRNMTTVRTLHEML